MIHFVGAGSGAPDLITVRGERLLRAAGAVVYAGSLVNPALLDGCRPDCERSDSARMTLEEVLDTLLSAERRGLEPVRLHTGDPCLYGAIREQMDALDAAGAPYELVPGVSSFCGAAAALRAEYTLPGVSQSVIITRMAGRTPVPERERVRALAQAGCTMVIFLSASLLDELQQELLEGAYTEDTPAAIVYRATWPDEAVYRCTVGTLARTARENGVSRMALITVGEFLADRYERSKLYDPAFTTGWRKAKHEI